MFPHIRWVRWLVDRGSVMCRPRPITHSERRAAFDFVPAILPCLAIAAALLAQLAGLSLPSLGREWVRLDPRSCPVELLPALRKVEWQVPTGTPIFNEMLFGGFLIYHTPGLRVFIDDRCELYGDEDLLAYALALRDDPGQIDRWADRYGFDLALTRAGSRFDAYLRKADGWTILGATETATLFRRETHAEPAPGR
jgi:hypothetical protein